MQGQGYYDRTAREYAQLRHFSTRAAVALKRSIGRLPEGPILELGCGTGNLTRLLRRLFPGRTLAALDLSRGMLTEARTRISSAQLIRADARSLPLANGTFALAAGAYFMHHIDDWRRVVGEAVRILRPDGVFALFTSARYRIKKHCINRFFPSFREIDIRRFPAEHALVGELRTNGFETTRVSPVSVGLRRLDAGFVDRTRRRFMSTFELVPEEEFREGLERLEAHVDGKSPPRRYRHFGILITAHKTQ